MHLIIVFDLTLKQKCIKQYKQLKYKPEMRLKHQINYKKKNWLKRLNPHISKDK